MNRYFLSALIIVSLCIEPAAGQFNGSVNDQFSLNGYARGMAFIGGETAEESILMSEISCQGALDIKPAFLQSDLRFRMGEALGENISILQVKELYGGYRGEKLDVLLGNQILVWGRTDGFSPNDYLNSSDYFFLSPEQDDQRLSVFMLRTGYRISPSLSIEAIAVPVYKPSVYRYDLFDMGGNATFSDLHVPEKRFENGTLAGRINADLPFIGLSIYGFNGYAPYYGFDIDTVDWSSGSPEIRYSPSTYRYTAFGADFDVAIGNAILRGEIAYKMTEDHETEIHIPGPALSYVVALEYNAGVVSVLGQYIGNYVLDFTTLPEPVLTDPANPLAQYTYANELIRYESELFNRRIFHQQEKMNHAVSLAVNGQFFYSTLNAELAGYYNLTSEEYLIRPAITWHISDYLAFSLGGLFMGGPDQSLFDYSGTVMNGLFSELKITF